MKDMQAGVLDSRGKIGIKYVGIEELKDNEVLVEIDACGICGSDLESFRENTGEAKFLGGHEISGRVVEKAPGAGGPEIGRRVSVMPLIKCEECEACKSGKGTCTKPSFIGLERPGGFAGFVAVPDTNLFELTDDIDANIAVLVDPIAFVIHSTALAGDLRDKNVVVFGAGTIGLITILVAKLQGARTISAIGRYIHQRDLAKRFGAEMVYDPQNLNLAEDIIKGLKKRVNTKADAVIETVQTKDTSFSLKLAETLNPGGALVRLGGHHQASDLKPLDLGDRDDIRICTTKSYSRADYADAITLIARSGIRIFDLSPIITHRIDLDEIARGYDIALTKEAHRAVKVVIRP